MQPENTTPSQLPDQQVQPAQASSTQQLPPAAAPQDSNVLEKKLKNASRSVLSMGLLYVAIMILGLIGWSAVPVENQTRYLLTLVIGTIPAVIWTVTGILALKNIRNYKKAVSMLQVSAITAYLILFTYLAMWFFNLSSLNVGFLLVVVFTVYLVVSLPKIQSLAKLA